MEHTHSLSQLKISSLRLIKGRHLLLVATFVLLASAGFAAFFYGRTAAFVMPSLGTAQNFAILGGSTVTNVPDAGTIVNGDLGVWPGAAITGFPPGIVNGTINAGNAVAMQAQSDLTTAYNALAGLPCGTNLTGMDLGGMTLAPGVYCFNTSAQLTGTLTLDAQGNPDASFIFQIGSTLVTASNAAVQVINGAQGCGAFWQVGSSATLGTGTSFIGSILAEASITLTDGVTLSGRALARTAAVTMDSNVVTRTTCAPTIAKTFTPPTINVNGISQLTITLSNPNTIVATLTAPFTDNLPAGVTIATPPNAANTCGGVVTATPGGSAVTLTGGAIPAGNGTMDGTCTITVNVTSGLPGSYLNTIPIGALQTSNGNNTNPASATLTVLCPVIVPTITAPIAVCALTPGNVSFVPDAGVGATYNWTITGGTIISGQGTASIIWTAGATGPVMLSVTITTSPGCFANGATQVTINPNPTAAAGPPQTLCQTVPGPTVFTLNGMVTNGTPQWSIIGSTGTAVGAIVSPNSATTNVNVTGNGTVTLRLTVTSNTTPSCGTTFSDTILTVNA
ncbi:MAG: ice-binding family protein, partial [Acidobacteriota bacterium]